MPRLHKKPDLKASRSRRRSLLRLLLGVLAAIGLLFLIVTFTPLNFWWADLLRGRDHTEHGDVLIVLSGSMGEDGSMGWSSYLRTTYAARAFREGGFKHVLVTGGSPSTTPPVSQSMADFLKFQGVPAEAIHVETKSRSTRENAVNSVALLNDLTGRRVLLTSEYHVFRARRAFARAGVEVDVQPVPDVLKRSGGRLARWDAFLDLASETVKIGYYWVRGWI